MVNANDNKISELPKNIRIKMLYVNEENGYINKIKV
jgi:hypothetical protein